MKTESSLVLVLVADLAEIAQYMDRHQCGAAEAAGELGVSTYTLEAIGAATALFQADLKGA